MFRHILLPTDGSPASLRSAHVAVTLASRCGARLTALNVLEPEPAHTHHGGRTCTAEIERIASAQRQSQRDLADVTSLAQRQGTACATAQMTAEAPYRAIEDFADGHACDLIVMGSHGKHGLERWVLGSQTQKLLHSTRHPVLVCTHNDSYTFERILLLVDGSDASDRAVSLSVAMAATLGSCIFALHVMTPLPTVNVLADYIAGDLCFHRLTARAQELLEETQRAGEAAGVEVSTECTFDRRPDTVVAARASSRQCDLIVIPGHGPGHEYFRMRDLAQQLLTGSDMPVLVCP